MMPDLPDDDYDWQADAIGSWRLAISEQRKRGIAAGDIDWITLPEMYIAEARRA